MDKMKKETMNILISIDNSYVSHAMDLVMSLKDHNDVYFNIYIIYDDTLSQTSIAKLNKFIIDNNIGTLKPYYFDANKLNFPVTIEHISKVTYYRLFAPFIIDEDINRLLYLDCDILCTGSIAELYYTSFENNVIAAAKNIIQDYKKKYFNYTISRLRLKNYDNYINAGVLLINVLKYREFTTSQEIYNFIINNSDILVYQDQDVINKLFEDKIKIVDKIYNYQINAIEEDYLYDECILVHYSEKTKPWKKDYPKIKAGYHYYKFLKDHGRLQELQILLRYQHNNMATRAYNDILEETWVNKKDDRHYYSNI